MNRLAELPKRAESSLVSAILVMSPARLRYRARKHSVGNPPLLKEVGGQSSLLGEYMLGHDVSDVLR